MITVSGTTRLTFMLPTDVQTAFLFFQDINRIITNLPRIEHIHSHSEQHLRLCYVSRELNTYDVRIYCDVIAEYDAQTYSVRLRPKRVEPVIKASSGLKSTTAYGRYSSESVFYPEGSQTRLEYAIQLQAELPKPWAVKFVPDGVMSAIASNITNVRIKEIADGFINQSIAQLPK